MFISVRVVAFTVLKSHLKILQRKMSHHLYVTSSTCMHTTFILTLITMIPCILGYLPELRVSINLLVLLVSPHPLHVSVPHPLIVIMYHLELLSIGGSPRMWSPSVSNLERFHHSRRYTCTTCIENGLCFANFFVQLSVLKLFFLNTLSIYILCKTVSGDCKIVFFCSDPR